MKTPKRIVCFGDGLVESAIQLEVGGFALALAEEYAGRADVLVRGFGGYNTREIKTLAAEVAELHPQVVIFGMGNSDSVLEGQIQHVPLDVFRENLEAMISEFAERGAWPLVITPVAPNEDRIRCRSLAVTRDYALACRQVAEDMRAEVADLFHGMQLCDDWSKELLLRDGISLSRKGHAVAFRLIKNVIEQMFPRASLPRLIPELNAPA